MLEASEAIKILVRTAAEMTAQKALSQTIP